MEKIYPINIAGIKNIGVEEWLENYYIPVTGRENYLIYNKVQTAYLSVLKKNQNDVVYWIAISNIYIIHHISQYILELLRFSRLKDKGFSYIVGQKKEEIPSDISTYDFTCLSNINLICKRISELTPQERAKDILRAIKYNILQGHLTNKNFLKNISKPYYSIGYGTQHEVASFCRENEIAPIHLPPMIFAKKVPVKTNNDSQYVEMMEFIMKFLNLVRKRHPIIDNSAFELLRKSIEDCFSDSLFFFRQNIRVFGKHKPKNLLFSAGFGSQIHRLFCSAWRYAGGRVIGFSHGGSYNHCYSPRNFNELSMAEQYIVSSKGNEEIIKQSAKDFFPDYKTANIVHIKKNIYKPLFGKLQSDPPVNKIKKIMVVGAVVEYHFNSIDTEYHTFSFLYNDIQLIKILKKAGYYITYKPRPETTHETYGIFEMYADDVLKGELEDVYNSADCLIFSSPYSSAFGFSLLSNKPIVLINVEGYLWYTRAFELIKKRCSIVEAYPADGRIVFNEKDVLNAVQESINNINYDILYEFAF